MAKILVIEDSKAYRRRCYKQPEISHEPNLDHQHRIAEINRSLKFIRWTRWSVLLFLFLGSLLGCTINYGDIKMIPYIAMLLIAGIACYFFNEEEKKNEPN